VRPILLELPVGGTVARVPAYGLAIAIGVALGLVLAAREARRQGLPTARFWDLSFRLVLASVVGSRLLFVLLNAPAFARLCAEGRAQIGGPTLRDCTAALRIWEGGLVFYGGVIAAAAVVYVFARRERWSVGVVADAYAPGLALAHVFGRLGCFAAGCCYGKACPPGGPGVRFPAGSVAHADLLAHGHVPPGATHTGPLHPTQLYEATGELTLLVALLALRRWRAAPPGRLAMTYALLYAALRFGVEVYRGDAARKFLFALDTPGLARALGLPPAEPLFLSTSQAVSVALIALVLGLWWKTRRTAGGEGARAS
jgi:phosphatidylglycerol:prolipoprotein diacylglycerol transferase